MDHKQNKGVVIAHGIKAVEVEEDELGIPVTASYHVKIPPRHNAVFEVNIHAETEGMQVIKGNKHLLEKHPNMYQHEIAMMSEENSGKISFIGNHKPRPHENFASWLREKW